LDKGETYFDKNENYPLRKNVYKPKSGSLNGNAKISEEEYILIINDLKKLELSFDDICNKYCIT